MPEYLIRHSLFGGFRNTLDSLAGIRPKSLLAERAQEPAERRGSNSDCVNLAGGSAMLQAMAYGGSLGDSLFSNVSFYHLDGLLGDLTNFLDHRCVPLPTPATGL